MLRPWPATCSAPPWRTGCRGARRWRPGCGPATSTRWWARSSCSGRDKPLRALIEADRLSSVVLWGPPGTGKTTDRPARGRRDAEGVRADVGGHRGREGRARGGRAGACASRGARPGHDPLPRRGAPLQPHAAGRALAARRGRAARARERDHGEPVLLAHRTVALAVDVVPARAARRRPRSAHLARARDRPTPTAVSAPTGSRSTPTRASTSPSGPKATPATRSPRSRSPPRSRSRPAVRRSHSPTPRPHSRCGHCATATTSTTTSLSAFIKSIRGSDPDAGLYWLARMLEAGEDARFIARRLVILASEDIGLADPMSLLVADAAARAVEFVGLPGSAAQPRAGGAAPRARARSRTR